MFEIIAYFVLLVVLLNVRFSLCCVLVDLITLHLTTATSFISLNVDLKFTSCVLS